MPSSDASEPSLFHELRGHGHHGLLDREPQLFDPWLVKSNACQIKGIGSTRPASSFQSTSPMIKASVLQGAACVPLCFGSFTGKLTAPQSFLGRLREQTSSPISIGHRLLVFNIQHATQGKQNETKEQKISNDNLFWSILRKVVTR